MNVEEILERLDLAGQVAREAAEEITDQAASEALLRADEEFHNARTRLLYLQTNGSTDIDLDRGVGVKS
jgi:hypothetical protein